MCYVFLSSFCLNCRTSFPININTKLPVVSLGALVLAPEPEVTLELPLGPKNCDLSVTW